MRRDITYEMLSKTDWAPPRPDQAFEPTVFMDISEYLARKLEALACYQTKSPPGSCSVEAAEALAHLRGATVSVSAARNTRRMRHNKRRWQGNK